MSLTGNCHCGVLHFTCDADPTRVMTCNCSICRRKGSVLHFVNGPQVRMTADPRSHGVYRFHRQIIAHHFCKTCGIGPWVKITLPDGTRKIALNLRASDVPCAHLPSTEIRWRRDTARLPALALFANTLRGFGGRMPPSVRNRPPMQRQGRPRLARQRSI